MVIMCFLLIYINESFIVKKIRLFVHPAGTASGFHLIETAHHKFGRKVHTIAGDINPPQLVAASTIADETMQTPPVSSNSFHSKMRRILTKAKADFYLPLIDMDCVSFPQNRNNNNSPINISVPKESVMLFLDKYKQRLLLREKKIPVERSFHDIHSALAVLSKKQIITKTKTGFGSHGVAVWDDRKAINDSFFAERCRLPECTTDVLYWRKKVYTITRERVDVKDGVAVKCYIDFSQVHYEIARALCAAFTMPTVFNLQTMIKRGEPVITDLNPRIGAGTPMARFAGIDFAANLIGLSLGLWQRPRIKNISKCTVVRAYREFLMP